MIWIFTRSSLSAMVKACPSSSERALDDIALVLECRENPMKTKLSIGFLLLSLASAALGATTTGLPFINDDYPKALTDAKQQKLPIFVEVWAPW